MPDKTLFYVWEDGEEGYCVYDAVDDSDAWAQHCAAGLADVADRDFHFAGAAFETKDGAIVSFFTSNQETGNLASATLHAVFIDEPPTEDQWGELSQRVKHHTVAPLGAEAVNKLGSDFEALQDAAQHVRAAWLDGGGSTNDRELDRALEALQEVLDA